MLARRRRGTSDPRSRIRSEMCEGGPAFQPATSAWGVFRGTLILGLARWRVATAGPGTGTDARIGEGIARRRLVAAIPGPARVPACVHVRPLRRRLPRRESGTGGRSQCHTDDASPDARGTRGARRRDSCGPSGQVDERLRWASVDRDGPGQSAKELTDRLRAAAPPWKSRARRRRLRDLRRPDMPRRAHHGPRTEPDPRRVLGRAVCRRGPVAVGGGLPRRRAGRAAARDAPWRCGLLGHQGHRRPRPARQGSSRQPGRWSP